MCDYSLAEVSNRLAAQGEQLLLHRFPTGSMGLRPARRRFREVLFPCSVTAVCIPPGATLFLQDISMCLRRELGVSAAERVTFSQLGLEEGRHRDAVRFRNGKEVLLQRLMPDQRVTVLSLEYDEHSPDAPERARLIAGGSAASSI